MLDLRNIHRVALVALGLAMVHSYWADQVIAEEKAPPRAATTNLKGIELYCSHDKKAEKWSFALLPGTNALKTAGQVKAALTIAGIDKLKTELSKLAEGETVFCYGQPVFKSDALDTKTLKDLKKFCKSKKITLR